MVCNFGLATLGKTQRLTSVTFAPASPAFSQAGIAGGVILLIISALMNFWAVHMLVKCYVRVSDASKRATTYSYSAVMYELAGNRGVAVIECTLFFAVLGARMSGVLVLSWGNLARSAYFCSSCTRA